VFEHGDFSEPNLIWVENRRLGVVDWELAEPRGLPAHDLVFLLAHAAFAVSRARTTDAQAAAYRSAFAPGEGWAAARLAAYADRLGIERELIQRLVVACWARQTAALVARTAGVDPRRDLVEWLRRNRYHALWRESVRVVSGG
jgi:aminoglycoside/choline kinase family phosphotransferase